MIADSDEAKGYNRVLEFSKDYGRKRVAFIQMNPANYVLLKSLIPTLPYLFYIFI